MINHEILSKINRFTSIMTKSLRNFSLRKIKKILGFIFFCTSEIDCFFTKIECNAVVSLHFEGLTVNNYWFYNMRTFVCKKIKQFNYVWIKVRYLFLNILKTYCNSVQERAMFSHTETLNIKKSKKYIFYTDLKSNLDLKEKLKKYSTQLQEKNKFQG